jgi:hypothetical protein
LLLEKGGDVLQILDVTIEAGAITSIDVLLCPDRDNDSFDQSTDCDDTDSAITGERPWYEDLDGDGFGNEEASTLSCVRLQNTVLDSTDCFDGNSDAFPGQTAFFATDRGDGSYDYNCDSVEDLEFPNFGVCRSGTIPSFCTSTLGWIDTQTIPQCGDPGNLQIACSLTSPCTSSSLRRQQTCR